jgi:hypothetical protein
LAHKELLQSFKKDLNVTTNNSVDSPLAGTTGTGNFVGSTSPTIVTPIISQINDTNSKALLALQTVASAVNYITLINSATGVNPQIQSSGSDTNITLQIEGTGTGGVALHGSGTNDSVGSGYIGEFISSIIASGSAVSFSNGTVKDMTSISLTAGDWDVWGNITFVASVGMTNFLNWISSSSATLPDNSLYNQLVVGVSSGLGMNAPSRRFSLSSTTTIYISAYVSFASGTAVASGGLYARRRR